MVRTLLQSVCLCLLAAVSPMIAAAAADDTIAVAQLPLLTHIHGIAVDRNDPTRLYVATHHGFFVATPDGMATRLSPIQDFMGFTPHPNDSSMLYASGHPASGGNLGFIASSDGGATWAQLSPGLGGPVDFHQMDVSPVDPQTIYGAFGGIQVSQNGGRTWAMAGQAPEGLVTLAASAGSASRVYAATKSGLWLSEDGGQSWNAGHFEGDIVSMLKVESGGAIFAFVVGQGLLQGSETDLTRWTLVSDAFADAALIHYAVDPTDPQRAYAVTQDSVIFASVDGGHSWHPFGAQ